TRHLIRLVNDLRELSLAEAGQLPLEKTATNLNNLVAETLQALEPLAAEKEIIFSVELSPFPEMNIDPFRIRQVLFNLLSNALRHTPAGGKISVTGSFSGNFIKLSILDTGEGLETDELAAVFNRFYRADKSRSRDSGSSRRLSKRTAGRWMRKARAKIRVVNLWCVCPAHLKRPFDRKS
ncbi:MAG: HAMP domain-containing sensor histidine kinase, partial [Chloroflexi bacterium]|nr:HAMP domain-containing sensor histidine kinase [Chloroflexota bacterium]